MASLHLFNPDNDIALARDVDNFTAPTAARDIRHAGSTLPMWYGTPGDRIIARGVSARWYDSVEKLFSTGIDVIGDSSPDTFIPSPWGCFETRFHQTRHGPRPPPRRQHSRPAEDALTPPHSHLCRQMS